MYSDFFSKIELQLSKELPFVVYRKPTENKLTAIFQKDNELHTVNDYSETGFVFAPFDFKRPTYYLKSDSILYEKLVPIENKLENKVALQVDPNLKEFHIALIRKGIAAIERGLFTKVVLSREITAKCIRTPLELFQTLMFKYENALRYLWYHPSIGMWIGATPEILLRAEDNRFATMSLAGTQPFLGNKSPKTWGKKEKEEQKLVTDYIFKALKNKISNLEISKTESVRAGKLWHLRTKLSGLLNDNLAEVVKALHPTPAVCGLPMESAKNFILDNENYDRNFYTGFLGELNLKVEKEDFNRGHANKNDSFIFEGMTTTFFVNLRCAKIKETDAIIYVGGGITKDSEAEKEWDETVAKSATMLDILLNYK